MPSHAERAAYYRNRAAQVRAFANGELNETRRRALLQIAAQYEQQAADLESGTMLERAGVRHE